MKTPLPIKVFCLILISNLFFNTISIAQISGSGTPLSVVPSSATVIDPNIIVGGSSNITNATVQIASNFYTGDILSFDASVASSFGITGSYAATSVSGILTFTGTASPANWQTLFRTVTYQNTAAACGPSSRSIIFIQGSYTYASFNGHYYAFVDANVTWPAAKAAAAASTFNGMQGYLATSTSVAENNFIWKLLSADAWIGASYDYQEINAATGATVFTNQSDAIGNVYWVTGPEKGTYISSGLNSPVAQNGQYMNWNGGEPNDAGNEYAVELYSSNDGRWNDLNEGDGLPYIIEYGGMPGDVPQNNSFSRALTLTSTVGGDISGGNDSVCEGTNSTILVSSAAVSGVSIVRWESSLDNFLTAGTPINNTSASLTVTNLSQTTYFRSIANGNSCSEAASSSTKISVVFFSTGSLSAVSPSLCNNGVAKLTLSGYSGTILKWQSSTDNNTWADIANTSATYNSDSLPAGTYYYRVALQSSSTCSNMAYCNPISIAVSTTPYNNNSVGGFVSLGSTGCGYGSSGNLNLNGYTGNILGWQYSTDNGTTWQNDNSGYTTQYYFNAITSTTQYRALVQNDACSNIAYSSVYTLTAVNSNGNLWNGSSSTNFGDANNWSCGSVPNPGDNITIGTGSTNMPMLDQDRIIGNIAFEKNTNMNVNGYALTLNGVILGDSTGNITGSSSSALNLGGNGDAGTIYFDHSNPGNSDVINALNLNMHATTAPVAPSSPVCAPVANWGYNGEGITNVTLGNINNSMASQNGYTDYRTIQYTTVAPSSNNTVSVTTDPVWGQQQAILIWIDWNNDGIFGDGPNETIINYGGGNPGTYPFDFTAPAIGGDIAAGPKTMRVYVEDYWAIYFDDGFDQCNGGWGDYEDYQIDLSYSPALINSKFTLGNNLSIANSIAFTNGVISTNNNLLILNAGSTVSGASDSSHVNGNVRKVGNTAFTFPVGNADWLAPISMSAPSDIADHFTASYAQANPLSIYNNTDLAGGLLSLSNVEYWLLERTNGNSNVAVTLSWDTSRNSNILDLVSPTVAHWNGSAWTNAGRGGNITGTIKSGTVTSSLVTSFSPFALGTSSGTLALTLMNFTAVRNNQFADLTWQTTNETNTNYFDIERSTDGSNWAKIGSAQAMGTNIGINNYKFTDSHPVNGDDYYRLKQVDNSGSFSYSTVRIVHFDPSQNVLVYPSPFNSTLTIDAGANVIGDLSILDLSGRVVYHSKISATKQTLNLASLATGQYTVMMNGNSFPIIKTE